jgi:hypothetical protein
MSRIAGNTCVGVASDHAALLFCSPSPLSMAMGPWYVIYDGALTCGASERGRWVVFGIALPARDRVKNIEQKWSQTIGHRFPDTLFVA